MVISAAPPVPEVGVTWSLGDRVVDLRTRAMVVAVVPPPRWARENEVVAGVRAAAASGADLIEVPAEPRLVGPAAQAADVPLAVRVDSAEAAEAAHVAGASVLLVPKEHIDQVIGDSEVDDRHVAVLVPDARSARDALLATTDHPVAIDVTPLQGADAVSEESLGISVGARLIRTSDVRRTRRVVEVMAHLLEARRSRSEDGAGGEERGVEVRA